MKLPNYVLKKKFNCHYLFLDIDVIFDENFHSDFIIFLKEIGSNQLKYISKNKNLESTEIEVESLTFLYNSVLMDNSPTYAPDHFLLDENHSWEFFVSLEYELAILGCKFDIKSKIETILKPYSISKFQEIINIASKNFKTEESSAIFFKQLISEYNF